MAEEPLSRFDQTDVTRFLRSGAGIWTSADMTKTHDALKQLIEEASARPGGPVAAGLWSVLIGLFLQQASRAALGSPDTKAAPAGRSVGDLMTRDPWTARPDQTLSELVNRLFLARAISFAPVVEDGTLLGYVDIHMVRRIDRENWTSTSVNDVIESVGPDNAVSPALPGDALFARIARTGRRKFLVVLENSLVGVVSLSDVMSDLDVSRQLRQSPPARA